MSIRRIVWAAACLSAIGCASADGVGSAEEDVGTTSQAIRGGDPQNLAARPYEELMVILGDDPSGAIPVMGCSGILVPSNSTGIASYALTARHCVDGGVIASHLQIGREDTGRLSWGKAILMHPDTFTPTNDDIDVALVELETPVTVSHKVYFTTSTPTQLIGQTARCYGGGGPSGFTMLSGLFTIRSNIISGNSPDNPAIHVRYTTPNAAGQQLMGGDSGGPCIRPPTSSNITVYDILKTPTRHMAAVSFSDWVRSVVPR